MSRQSPTSRLQEAQKQIRIVRELHVEPDTVESSLCQNAELVVKDLEEVIEDE